MIILEGPDCSGKTGLAHSIAEEFDVVYRRPPSLDSVKGVDEGVHRWWAQQFLGTQKYMDVGVYDRCFYISEPIYSSVMGRPPICTTLHMGDGIAKMRNFVRPLVIFCLPPWSKILSVDEERPQLEGMDAAKEHQIYWLYWAFYELWRGQVPTTRYTWTNKRMVMNRVDEYLQEGTASG